MHNYSEFLIFKAYWYCTVLVTRQNC